MSLDRSTPRPPDASAPGYPAVQLHEGEPPGLALGDLIGVVRRKLWLILVLGALAFGATYYMLSRQVRMYQAEALVRLRDGGARLAGAVLGSPGQQTGGVGAIQSEIMVIQGRALAAEVVEREGLRLVDPGLGRPSPLLSDVVVTLPPDATEQLRLTFGSDSLTARIAGRTASTPYGTPLVIEGLRFTVSERPSIAETTFVALPKDRVVDWLLSRFSARPRSGTDVVSVTLTSNDPRLAVRLVNGVVDAYQDRNAMTSQEEARARREFIDAELRHTDSALVAAQSALEALRTREQVYRSDQQAAAAQQMLAQIDREATDLGDERRVFMALLAELGRPALPANDALYRTMIATPAVARNPVVSQYVGRLTQQHGTRDSLLIAGMPASHERVRQLDSLLAGTRERIVEAMRSHVDAIDAQLAGLSERRARNAAEIRRLSPASAEETRLVLEVERIRARGDQLRQQKEIARITEATALGNVEILEHATRAIGFSGNRTRMLGLGLAAGLFVGVGLAFLLENLNTSIHRRSELETILHAPGLAVIPQLPRPGRGFLGWITRDAQWATNGRRARHGKANGASRIMPSADGLVTVTHSHDRSAEAYRVLRTKLLYLREQLTLNTLVVTSAALGEGKTTTAANLATALAQLGVRVLLIDCDLRRPRLHALFGVTRAPGLTDVMKGTASAHQAIRLTSVDGLHLLPRGSPTSQPAEVLGGAWMVAALRELSTRYEMVIMDTPPLLSASEASSLAGRADGVLFVTRAGATDRHMVREAMHQLSTVGANVVGAVLNDPDAQVEKYENYGYGYAYQYPYQS